MNGPLPAARQRAVDELERASETVTELRGLLAERDQEIQRQLAENAELVRQRDDLKAILDHHSKQEAERRALIDAAAEALRQLKEKT